MKFFSTLLFITLVTSSFIICQQSQLSLFEQYKDKVLNKLSDPQFVLDSLISTSQKRIEKNQKISNDYLRDSLVIVWSENYREVHLYKYNFEGYKVEEFIYTIVQGVKYNKERQTFEYAPNGYWKTWIYETYVDQTWTYTFKEEREFPEYDLKGSYKSYIWNGEWILRKENISYYSIEGLLTSYESIFNYVNDEYGTERGLTLYTYDNMGRKTESNSSLWINDSLWGKIKITNEYDISGYSEIETEIDWIDNEWINKSRVSKIIENNLPKEERNEYWRDNKWHNLSLYKYNYSDTSLLSEQVQYYWGDWDTQWHYDNRYIFEYNQVGQMIFELYESWGGERWSGLSRTITEYNENSLLISEKREERYGNIDWKIVYLIDREYNNFNQLTYERSNNYYNNNLMEYYIGYDSKQHRNYIEEKFFQNDTLVYNDKTLLEFDSSDRLISEKIYSWENNVFQPRRKTYYYYQNGESIFREDFSEARYTLAQNYPNPFNPKTTITFSNSKQTNINISIFNILGQKVKTIVDKLYPDGLHTVQISSSGIASGTYIYRLEADGYIETKKMILLK